MDFSDFELFAPTTHGSLEEEDVFYEVEILKRELFNLVDENLTRVELMARLLHVFKIRHNVFQVLFCKFIGAKYEPGEVKFSDQCKRLGIPPPPGPLSRLSPDIVLLKMVHGVSTLIIADVSLTTQANRVSKEKVDKYMPLSDWSENNTIMKTRCFVYPICTDPRLSTLDNIIRLVSEDLFLNPADFRKDILVSFLLDAEKVSMDLQELISDPDYVSSTFEKAYGEAFNAEPVFAETLPEFDGKVLFEDEEIFDYSVEDAANLVKRIMESPESSHLEDYKTLKGHINEVWSQLELTNDLYIKTHGVKIKPSIYIPVPSVSQEVMDYIQTFNSHLFKLQEQNSIMAIMDAFVASSHSSVFQFEEIVFKEFSQSMKHKSLGECNRSIFESGRYIPNGCDEEALKTMFKDYLLTNPKNPSSFNDWMTANNPEGRPDNSQPRAVKQKIFRIPVPILGDMKKELTKAGIGVSGKEPLKERKYKPSVPFTSAEEVDEYLDFLSEPPQLPAVSTIYEDFLTASSGPDSDLFRDVKNASLGLITTTLDLLSNTNAYRMVKISHLLYEQMLHFQNISGVGNQFSFFNSGVPNMLVMMAGGFIDQGKDVGKPFKIIGFTDDLRSINKIFGSVTKVLIRNSKFRKPTYIFSTNWRRLPVERLSHLRDSYFTVLSTTLSTFMRHHTEYVNRDSLIPELKGILSLRTCIALDPSQKLAEMVADSKHAIMHCYSEMSNIKEFMLDKLAGPYGSCLESWVARRIEKAGRILDSLEVGGIQLERPEFQGSKQLLKSTGGNISIQSYWGDHFLTDIQDIMDDLYLYVLTPKEPASTHHEGIKALNTIMEYQEKFDTLTVKEKTGIWEFKPLLKKIISKRVSVGFHRGITKLAGQLLGASLKSKLPPSDILAALNEPLAELTSTKSVIPNGTREVVVQPITEKTKFKHSVISRGYEKIHEYAKVKTTGPKLPVNPGTNRVKVHDAILDMILRTESHPNKLTILNSIKQSLSEGAHKLEADICIKAQFGGKREFYVIDITSKLMMRLCENINKILCSSTPEEMISVPGDRKMIIMQDKMAAFTLKRRPGFIVYSVNGDCSKWSAAETLECFTAFNYGLRDVMPETVLKYLNHVAYTWANKSITVPSSILRATSFLTEKTEYLKKLDCYKFRSTQNFLQGMMNYASSLKSVSLSNLSKKIYKILYPKSTLEIDHLEHSDDYIHLISCRTLDELKAFRKVHKIVMKLGGINDSYKKTNVQRYFMEFLSLVNFNGQLIYPHIKKTKETGLNTACSGYVDDMAFATSRAGECVRVGVPTSEAYAMMRLQSLNISRAYSTLPGMHNNVWSLEEMFTMPVEIFGVPDVAPSILPFISGNTNNYRLNMFGSTQSRKALRATYYLEQLQSNTNPDLSEYRDVHDERFYHPNYVFDQKSKQIAAIRQALPLSREDALNYWRDQPVYNFIKPLNTESFKTWLQAMYYRHSFTLAYTRSSRVTMTLRLSRYTRTKCLIVPNSLLEELHFPSIGRTPITIDRANTTYPNSTLLTVKEYQDIMKQFISIGKELTLDEKFFNKALISGDPTCSILYSYSRNSVLVRTNEIPLPSSAQVHPEKPKWMHLDNSVSSVMQFIYDSNGFIKDQRRTKGITSLIADRNVIQDYYGESALDPASPLLVKRCIFRDLMLSKERPNVAISPNEQCNSIEDYVISIIKHNLMSNVKFEVVGSGTAEAEHPYNLTPFYKRENRLYYGHLRLISTEMLLLYGFLKHSFQHNQAQIINIMSKISFEAKGICIDSAMSELQMTTYDLYNAYSPTYTELKAFCFLKWVLYQDVEPMHKLASSNLAYGYQYIEPPPEIKSLDNKAEAVYINYMQNGFNAYHVKDTVIIRAIRGNRIQFAGCYIVALKLFNIITEREFNKRMNLSELSNIPLLTEDLKDALGSFRWGLKIISAPLKYGVGQSYPFIITPRIKELTYVKTMAPTLSLSVNLSTSTVLAGKLKLFTAPFLACEQNNSLHSNNDPNEYGIDLNHFLVHKRMYNLLHNQGPINCTGLDDFFYSDFFAMNSEKSRSVNKELKEECNRLFVQSVATPEPVEEPEDEVVSDILADQEQMNEFLDFEFDDVMEMEFEDSDESASSEEVAMDEPEGDNSDDEEHAHSDDDGLFLDLEPELLAELQGLPKIRSNNDVYRHKTDYPQSLQLIPSANRICSILLGAFLSEKERERGVCPLSYFVVSLKAWQVYQPSTLHDERQHYLLGLSLLRALDLYNVGTVENAGDYTLCRNGRQVWMGRSMISSPKLLKMAQDRNVLLTGITGLKVGSPSDSKKLLLKFAKSSEVDTLLQTLAGYYADKPKYFHPYDEIIDQYLDPILEKLTMETFTSYYA